MRGGPVRGFWVRCMEEKNKRQDKVVAITVTYNRTRTLERCLSALESQSRPVDKIIIVDNNSSEEEKLRLRQLVSGKQQVEVLWLPENAGGAGGFEAGMREARSMDPDWYWLMDDDAYPREDCLIRLLEAEGDLEKVGFLAPLIFGVDFQEYQLFHHKFLKGLSLKTVPVASDYVHLSTVTKIDANAFVGPLIAKKAVDLVGIADGSLFIYGDDTEYTYRITRKLNGYVIKNAVIEHQDQPITLNYISPSVWWKEYYNYRNQIFMLRKFYRWSVVRVCAYITMMLHIFKLVLAAIIKPKYKRFHILRAHLLIKALVDGLCDNRGKTIDPVVFAGVVKRKETSR